MVVKKASIMGSFRDMSRPIRRSMPRKSKVVSRAKSRPPTTGMGILYSRRGLTRASTAVPMNNSPIAIANVSMAFRFITNARSPCDQLKRKFASIDQLAGSCQLGVGSPGAAE